MDFKRKHCKLCIRKIKFEIKTKIKFYNKEFKTNIFIIYIYNMSLKYGSGIKEQLQKKYWCHHILGLSPKLLHSLLIQSILHNRKLRLREVKCQRSCTRADSPDSHRLERAHCACCFSSSVTSTLSVMVNLKTLQRNWHTLQIKAYFCPRAGC